MNSGDIIKLPDDYDLYQELRKSAGDNEKEIIALINKLNLSNISDFIVKQRHDLLLMKNMKHYREDSYITMNNIAKEVKPEELLEKLSDEPEAVVSIFSLLTPMNKEEYGDFQNENIDRLFEMANLTEKPEISFGKIWDSITDIKFKKEKFNTLLEKMNINSDKEVMEKLEQVINNNDDFWYTINSRFMKPELWKTFSVEQLASIVSFPEMQELLLSVSDQELRNIVGILNVYNKECPEWKEPLERITKNISAGKFGQMMNVSDIEYSPELFNTLINDNYFGIMSVDDIKHLAEKKNEVVQLIKSNNQVELKEKYPLIASLPKAEQRQMMICQKLFNISLEDAKNIVSLFGEDSDNLGNDYGDSYLKKYISGLKLVLREDSLEKLDEYLTIDSSTKDTCIDNFKACKMLKVSYGRKYDENQIDLKSLKSRMVNRLSRIENFRCRNII